ncbi:MAG TPA: hypothetical protein VJ742_11705 [Nitrososphaera sp.]|jgi:hypothetical protein|nr:hypothetical protein [Nitrososphaera sp.]
MEDHDNRISEINQHIDDTDQMIKKHAEETLRLIYDDYQRMVIERIKVEVALAEASRKKGNSALAKRHEILADVWKSLLDSDAISSRPLAS